MADAFVPACYKVRVNEGKAAERRTSLRIDLEVIKPLADKF